MPAGGAVGEGMAEEAGMVCGLRVRAMALGYVSTATCWARMAGSMVGDEEEKEVKDEEEGEAAVEEEKMSVGKG